MSFKIILISFIKNQNIDYRRDTLGSLLISLHNLSGNQFTCLFLIKIGGILQRLSVQHFSCLDFVDYIDSNYFILIKLQAYKKTRG